MSDTSGAEQAKRCLHNLAAVNDAVGTSLASGGCLFYHTRPPYGNL